MGIWPETPGNWQQELPLEISHSEERLRSSRRSRYRQWPVSVCRILYSSGLFFSPGAFQTPRNHRNLKRHKISSIICILMRWVVQTCTLCIGVGSLLSSGVPIRSIEIGGHFWNCLHSIEKTVNRPPQLCLLTIS